MGQEPDNSTNPPKSQDHASSSITSQQVPTSKPSPEPSGKPTQQSTNITRKETAPPAFEKGIIDRLVTEFGTKLNVVYIKTLRMKILVEPTDILEVATFLRDNLGFDHAESVAGTDYPKDNQIEVTYHLGSYTRPELEAHVIALATRASRDEGCHLPSLIDIFKSVEYHERETYEMLGVYFEGHPRNERFLLPEDWADIPPLRREFRIKGR